jgi:DNA-binding NarL/FixJ family response regulator
MSKKLNVTRQEWKRLLSERRIHSEKEVARFLMMGYENSAIAKEMRVATRTVKGYMAHMFIRYGINGFQGVKRVALATMLYRSTLYAKPVRFAEVDSEDGESCQVTDRRNDEPGYRQGIGYD